MTFYEDACEVDGGGPFICQRWNGDYEIQGLFSWRTECANPGFDAGVYTKVCYFSDWIREVLSRYSG